jgi:hypothetical protein
MKVARTRERGESDVMEMRGREPEVTMTTERAKRIERRNCEAARREGAGGELDVVLSPLSAVLLVDLRASRSTAAHSIRSSFPSPSSPFSTGPRASLLLPRSAEPLGGEEWRSQSKA